MANSVQFRRPESVLVLLYTRQGDVLLMQRADTPDFWQSVTGGLESGELPAGTAARELVEETGIDVAEFNATIIDHQCSSTFEISGVWRKRYHPEHTHNREHLFSVMFDEQVAVTLNDDEHLACIWLPAKRALERATSLTNKQVIEDIALAAQHRQ